MRITVSHYTATLSLPFFPEKFIEPVKGLFQDKSFSNITITTFCGVLPINCSAGGVSYGTGTTSSDTGTTCSDTGTTSGDTDITSGGIATISGGTRTTSSGAATTSGGTATISSGTRTKAKNLIFCSNFTVIQISFVKLVILSYCYSIKF